MTASPEALHDVAEATKLVNEQQQQQQLNKDTSPPKLVAPPRYDRFFAAARRYNPLVINEVRRAFQDNIRELATVECHCTVYYGAETVRTILLLTASGIAFYLFWYGNNVRFPENVPVMQNCIIAWFVLSVVALFYVLGYLEARNFSTLVLPSSSSSSTNPEDKARLIGLEKFIALARCDEEAERKAIRARYVDQDGNEVFPATLLEAEEHGEEEEEEREAVESEEETVANNNDNNDNNGEGEQEDEDEETEEDRKELESIIFPKRTEIKVQIDNQRLLDLLFPPQTSPSSQTGNNNNNKKKNDSVASKSSKSNQPENQQNQSSSLELPSNLGLQFYSEVVLGEPKVVIEASLVQFRGAFFSPQSIKSVRSTFYVEEFFSKEGLFYPPALRVEMRRILENLLLLNNNNSSRNKKLD